MTISSNAEFSSTGLPPRMVDRLLDDPVVITGVGMVTPLAAGREETWRAVQAGNSAARRLVKEDFHHLPDDWNRWDGNWIGCPADSSQPISSDPVVDLALRASREAVADADLFRAEVDPAYLGCVFGTSKGSLFAASHLIQGSVDHFETSAVMLGPALGAQAVAADLGLSGPVICPVAACATGVAAVLRGADLIRTGECDVVIVGSADDSLHPLVLASFQRLGVLASGTNPATASRPFDRLRRGFVIGAGAGTLVLERRSRARRRGHPWYAELGEGRLTSDPTGMTALDTSGKALARLIADSRTGEGSRELRIPDVVSLHGTGTRQNDPAECLALRQVFGQGLTQASCGSFKGGLGHLLGAAGSVELGLCCLMLRDQLVSPSVNLDDIDENCQLSWVTGRSISRPIASILKLSLGFGGHQAAVWLHRSTQDVDPARKSNH